MASKLPQRLSKKGVERRCRTEVQRVTQPDTPLPKGSAAPAGGATAPSNGECQKKRLHNTGSCCQQPPLHRISLQRTTRPRREPREHAVVSDLIRWYLHSPLLIPARPPRCSTMRNRSLTAIKAITQALLDRRASRVETRNFEILGDWFFKFLAE
jgi:hypothetical protein